MTTAVPYRKSVQPRGRTMSPSFAHGRLERRGFTLLELVLSLLLLAIVASFAITSFFAQSDMTLHNALRLLSDDIHEMQARASSLHIPVEIVFEPNGDGYHATDLAAPDPAKAHIFPLVARRYGSDAVFEGVKIRRMDLQGSDRISFDADGRSTQAGTIVIGYHDESRVLELLKDRGFTCLPDSPRTRGWLDHLR